MSKLIAFWSGHGTKVLGLIGGTIAAVAGIDGIIPPDKLKYAMATIALCTFWRGFTNTAAQRQEPPQ